MNNPGYGDRPEMSDDMLCQCCHDALWDSHHVIRPSHEATRRNMFRDGMFRFLMRAPCDPSSQDRKSRIALTVSIVSASSGRLSERKRLTRANRKATPEERARILEAFYFEGDRRTPYLQQFFVLMVLSAAIAAFGLVNDSAAVVIGAMLVAPLMTPILAISARLGRWRDWWRSLWSGARSGWRYRTTLGRIVTQSAAATAPTTTSTRGTGRRVANASSTVPPAPRPIQRRPQRCLR